VALQDFFSSVYMLETNDSFEGLSSSMRRVKQPPDLVRTSDCIYNKLVKLKIDKSPRPDHLHTIILYDPQRHSLPIICNFQ